MNVILVLYCYNNLKQSLFKTLTLLSRTNEVYSSLQKSPDYLVMHCPSNRW